MTGKFRSGILKGLGYYLIGVVTVWFTYVIFGWEYKHGPGSHHLVALLFLAGGLGLILNNLVLIGTGLKSQVNIGRLSVHVLVVVFMVIYFAMEIRNEDTTEFPTDPADIITIYKDSTTNTSSIVNGNGDTLFLRKGDSIFIDKTKIDTLDHR